METNNLNEYDVNNIIQNLNWNTDNLSDWYHTFWELYEHRVLLFISLMKCNPEISWRANNNDDGSNYPWRFVAWIHLPSGDISYYLPNEKWELLDNYNIKTTLNWPKRDWHTSNDVLDRLKSRQI